MDNEKPKSVQVLRLMRYTYDSAEAAVDDQKRWQVQGTYAPKRGLLIESTVLPMVFVSDKDRADDES